MCYRPSNVEIAEAENAAPKTKDCPECGTTNPLQAKVCEKCGAKFPPMKLSKGPSGPKGPSAPPAPAAPKPPTPPSAPKPRV